MERPPCSSKHLSLTANKSHLWFVLHCSVSLNSKEIPRTLANPWWPRGKSYGKKAQIRHGCYQFIIKRWLKFTGNAFFSIGDIWLHIAICLCDSLNLNHHFLWLPNVSELEESLARERHPVERKKERQAKWQIILLPIVTMSVIHPPPQPYL